MVSGEEVELLAREEEDEARLRSPPCSLPGSGVVKDWVDPRRLLQLCTSSILSSSSLSVGGTGLSQSLSRLSSSSLPATLPLPSAALAGRDPSRWPRITSHLSWYSRLFTRALSLCFSVS